MKRSAEQTLRDEIDDATHDVEIAAALVTRRTGQVAEAISSRDEANATLALAVGRRDRATAALGILMPLPIEPVAEADDDGRPVDAAATDPEVSPVPTTVVDRLAAAAKDRKDRRLAAVAAETAPEG